MSLKRDRENSTVVRILMVGVTTSDLAQIYYDQSGITHSLIRPKTLGFRRKRFRCPLLCRAAVCRCDADSPPSEHAAGSGDLILAARSTPFRRD